MSSQGHYYHGLVVFRVPGGVKGCGEVKGAAPLQGVHRLAPWGDRRAVRVVLVPSWVWAAGGWAADRSWGSLRESLALETWV